VQVTIKDSIHQLLEDTINRLGYHKYFTINKADIVGVNGSSFIFRGLKDLNADDIKSMEGISIVIIGEAQDLTQKSWLVLDPTIRQSGAEIWIIYNPQSETDFVYELTVKNPPKNMICEHVNYTDLPKQLLSDRIIEQAERMKKEDIALYNHIWLGHPSLGGRFFTGFGAHLCEEPFEIQESDLRGNLYGHLDSGTTHPTAFSVTWLAAPKFKAQFGAEWTLHTLFTYEAGGGTISSHADEIYNRIAHFPWLKGVMPEEIVYDPSMDTKWKPNEAMVRSAIQEYIDVFEKNNAKTRFKPANNDKYIGCQIMRMMMSYGTDGPMWRYWNRFNTGIENGLKRAIVDENNVEIYAKADGDDVCDQLRYGMMRLWVEIGSRKNISAGAGKVAAHNAKMSKKDWRDL
jgi:hypothetical protein